MIAYAQRNYTSFMLWATGNQKTPLKKLMPDDPPGMFVIAVANPQQIHTAG